MTHRESRVELCLCHLCLCLCRGLLVASIRAMRVIRAIRAIRAPCACDVKHSDSSALKAFN